jgi:hypothetical protein
MPVATTDILATIAGDYGSLSGIENGTPMYATIPGLTGGTPVFVGIAAWYSAGGANSYAAAVAAGVPNGYVESTSPVTLWGGVGSDTTGGLTRIGLTSFSLKTTGSPMATSLNATGITAHNATLNASVNPGGVATTVYFVYGATTNYGGTNFLGNIGSGTSALAISNNVTGLLANTLYHFQVFASNIGGTASGGDLTFTTPPAAPVLTSVQLLANGIIQFAFTNTPGASFTVLSSTNLTLPLANWTVAGVATNIGSGQFQFTSQPTTNNSQRFFVVRAP